MCPTGTDLQLDLGADLIIYTVLYVLLRRLITVRGMRIPPGLGLCPCSRGNKNSAKKFCDWPIVRVLSLGPWALGPASNKACRKWWTSWNRSIAWGKHTSPLAKLLGFRKPPHRLPPVFSYQLRPCEGSVKLDPVPRTGKLEPTPNE